MVRIKSEAQLPPYMRFPRFLLDAGLPANAVLTYIVLLDRTRLSMTNQGWKDLTGDVFIYYPLDELAETLHCSVRSITTALQQLSEKGLIERVHQGVGRANVIYVCVPDAHTQNSSNQTGNNLPMGLEGNCQPDWQKSSSLDGRKLPGNKNKRERITEQQSKNKDLRAAYGRFQNIFLSDEEFGRLSKDFSRINALLDDMSCYLASSGKTYQNYEAALRSWAKKSKESYAARCYIRREDESL